MNIDVARELIIDSLSDEEREILLYDIRRIGFNGDHPIDDVPEMTAKVESTGISFNWLFVEAIKRGTLSTQRPL
jgi:hypothetical protein